MAAPRPGSEIPCQPVLLAVAEGVGWLVRFIDRNVRVAYLRRVGGFTVAGGVRKIPQLELHRAHAAVIADA